MNQARFEDNTPVLSRVNGGALVSKTPIEVAPGYAIGTPFRIGNVRLYRVSVKFGRTLVAVGPGENRK